MKKAIRKIALIVLAMLCLASLTSVAAERPKKVILMIGDGMGIPHITATEFEKHHLSGLRRFKKLGLMTTFCANKYVTDSAAAATAMATGHKTNYTYVSVDPAEKPLKTVIEYAEEANKSTGIVVTSAINHATPAGFTAHVVNRNFYNDIIEQQVNSGVDVMFGGGLANLIPNYMRGSRRKDDKDLMSQLRKRMPVVQTIEAFRQLGIPRSAAAILDYGHLPPASKRNYTLGELTSKAIQILDRNDNGFFLMVEGSQIDLAAHKHDYERIMSEICDFDTAVNEALDFAQKDGNTLVVVTADHETGGLTLPDGSLEEKKAQPHFSTDNHSACMVAVFSYGPGSDNFTGIFDNTDIGKNLIELVK
ncbi:MAG: alkaline phosphatase [Candidatus Rifleibacteriota bacterium]